MKCFRARHVAPPRRLSATAPRGPLPLGAAKKHSFNVLCHRSKARVCVALPRPPPQNGAIRRHQELQQAGTCMGVEQGAFQAEPADRQANLHSCRECPESVRGVRSAGNQAAASSGQWMKWDEVCRAGASRRTWGHCAAIPGVSERKIEDRKPYENRTWITVRFSGTMPSAHAQWKALRAMVRSPARRAGFKHQSLGFRAERRGQGFEWNARLSDHMLPNQTPHRHDGKRGAHSSSSRSQANAAVQLTHRGSGQRRAHPGVLLHDVVPQRVDTSFEGTLNAECVLE